MLYHGNLSSRINKFRVKYTACCQATFSNIMCQKGFDVWFFRKHLPSLSCFAGSRSVASRILFEHQQSTWNYSYFFSKYLFAVRQLWVYPVLCLEQILGTFCLLYIEAEQLLTDKEIRRWHSTFMCVAFLGDMQRDILFLAVKTALWTVGRQSLPEATVGYLWISAAACPRPVMALGMKRFRAP